MKRFWTIFAVALVALGVTACSEGADEQAAPATEGVSFYASVNMGADSRTTLEKDDEGVWNTIWEGNETLLVKYNWGMNTYQFTNTPDEPNKFTCTDESVREFMEAGTEAQILNANAELAPNSALGANGLSIWSQAVIGTENTVVLDADCAILRYSSDYEVTFTSTCQWGAGFFGDGTDQKSTLTLPAGKDIIVPIFHSDFAGSGTLSYAIDGVTYGTMDLTPANGKLYNLGTLEKPFVAEKSEWGVVGDLTSWSENGDIAMYTTPTENVFVAKNITISEAQVYTGFKIRNKGNWTGINYGGHFAYFVADRYMSVWKDGQNMQFTEAGTYDIYFQYKDGNEGKVWLVKAGTDYTTVAEQTAEGPQPNLSDVSWGLCGTHNNWGTPDSELTWDGTLGMYVIKNIKLTGAFKVRGNNDWNKVANYGSGGTITVNKAAATTLYNNGGDCKVTSGTYDVYVYIDVQNVKNDGKIWVKTPGSAAPSL